MLDRFVRQNTTGFRKIMKKHDKWTKNQASAWFLPRLAQEPFNCLDFDGMLVLLRLVDTSDREINSGLTARLVIPS